MELTLQRGASPSTGMCAHLHTRTRSHGVAPCQPQETCVCQARAAPCGLSYRPRNRPSPRAASPPRTWPVGTTSAPRRRRRRRWRSRPRRRHGVGLRRWRRIPGHVLLHQHPVLLSAEHGRVAAAAAAARGGGRGPERACSGRGRTSARARAARGGHGAGAAGRAARRAGADVQRDRAQCDAHDARASNVWVKINANHNESLRGFTLARLSICAGQRKRANCFLDCGACYSACHAVPVKAAQQWRVCAAITSCCSQAKAAM
jgi:hypothetical protein